MKLGKSAAACVVLIICIIGSALATYSHSNTHYQRKADKLFNNGDHASAAEFYTKVKKPNLSVLVKKEKAEFKTGRYNEALKTMQLIQIKSGDSAYDIFVENNMYYDEITCCFNLKMHDKVINESKPYFETSNDKMLDTFVEEYVSLSYIALEKYDEDIQFINDCFEKYDDARYKSHMTILYNHLDACYCQKEILLH